MRFYYYVLERLAVQLIKLKRVNENTFWDFSISSGLGISWVGLKIIRISYFVLRPLCCYQGQSFEP